MSDIIYMNVSDLFRLCVKSIIVLYVSDIINVSNPSNPPLELKCSPPRHYISSPPTPFNSTKMTASQISRLEMKMVVLLTHTLAYSAPRSSRRLLPSPLRSLRPLREKPPTDTSSRCCG